MKTLIASIIALTVTTMTSATPFVDSRKDIPDMVWNGVVKMGEANITLSGTAESVYKQIIAMNPNWDAEFGPNHEETKRDVAARQWGAVNCSWGSKIAGWSGQCGEGYEYLRRLGNTQCGAPWGVEMRVSCSHTCGVYLTSLNGGHVNVNCGDIAKDMVILRDSCSSPAGFVHGSITFGGSHWIGLGATRC